MTLISFIALSTYLILIVGEVSFGQQAFFGIGAYVTAIYTALFDFPLLISLILAILLSTLVSLFLSIATNRLSGIYFSIATLAFAELFRSSLLEIYYTVSTPNGITGPNGPEGFQNIRWIFDNNITAGMFSLGCFLTLSVLVISLLFLENTSLFKNARLVGKDIILAESLGIRPAVYRGLFIGTAGGIAGFGGGLFALHNTYIEPSMFGIMLGVHALAYTVIGGLGSPIGPLLGVILDIGFLESIRAISEYRMIIFGGAVALVLIVFPEGLINSKLIQKMKRLLKKK